MPRKKEEYQIPVVLPKVIKRNRSISLEGEKFTFTDLRKLLSEAAIDGYAEDSSVSVYSDHYAARYNTVTISEAK